LECRLRARDGLYRWFLIQAVCQRDESGAVEWWVGTCTDIDALKLAGAALSESEERFRTMANSISQLAWIAQPDGFITWYNERWYDYTGTTPEQMEGWGWQSVHDPEALPRVLVQWRESIATAEPFNMTFPLRGADGVFRLFLTRGMPLKDQQGRVLGWFGTNTDVDELKRAEEAAARLAAIVEFSRDAIIGQNLEGKVTSWNGGAERMFGYSASEMLGQPITRIIPGENQEDEAKILNRINCGEYLESYEARRLCKDGKLIDVSVTISPIKDTAGHVVGASKVARDITERKRAEQMKISLEEKEVLLREIHHRVKNNLQVITSLIQLQSGYLRDPRDAEIFKECQERIHAMGLIHDRLYRSGNLATIDFSEHLRELIALITRSQSGTVDRIRLNVESEPLEVDLDTAIPLGLIPAELITNAYKHAFRDRPGGLISVRLVRNAPSRVTLSVEDDGVGLPAGLDLEKVRSLGLRLARTLARQLRAELSLASSNTGSKIQVIFPLRNA
ncbi:MAG: PAS domain S-box protein, partial [Opitutaceae bacterium]